MCSRAAPGPRPALPGHGHSSRRRRPQSHKVMPDRSPDCRRPGRRLLRARTSRPGRPPRSSLEHDRQPGEMPSNREPRLARARGRCRSTLACRNAAHPRPIGVTADNNAAAGPIEHGTIERERGHEPALLCMRRVPLSRAPRRRPRSGLTLALHSARGEPAHDVPLHPDEKYRDWYQAKNSQCHKGRPVDRILAHRLVYLQYKAVILRGD